MRKILVVLVAATSLLSLGCEEGSNPIGGGACVVGTTAVCTTQGGQSGSRTCDATGAYGECVAGGGQCVPNTVNSCVTACTTVGTQTCSAAGAWGNCVGTAEDCNGKDDDCNGQTDEGLIKDCLTNCGSGKMQCMNAAWTLCSAPSPQVEQCNGKDDDCNGQTDENLSVPSAALKYGVCIGQSQTCKGVKGWEDPDWSTVANYEVKESTCDGLDNDCDGLVDANDPDVGNNCACTTGEQPKPCGTDTGECSKGQQECVPSPSGGNAWTECGGTTYNPAVEELCDGLDNDCDSQTDEGNPGGAELCGTASKSQGGVYEAPCTVGQVVCDGGQRVCMGGVDPTPEVCDDVDNDCDGASDEDISFDQYESNNTCGTAKDVGKAIEGQVPLVISGTLYDPSNTTSDDVDWYKITAAEGGGFCFPGSSEGPFTVKVRLTNIPTSSDYDLCVWNAESSACGALPATDGATHDEGADGYCMEQSLWKNGSDPEEFTYTWDGECLKNDDQTFYVKVVGYDIDPNIDCAPYNLEVTVTK